LKYRRNLSYLMTSSLLISAHRDLPSVLRCGSPDINSGGGSAVGFGCNK
jgi:hypothetical protein